MSIKVIHLQPSNNNKLKTYVPVPIPIGPEQPDKATAEKRKREFVESMSGYFDLMKQEPEPDYDNMTDEQFKDYIIQSTAERNKKWCEQSVETRKALTAKEAPLAEKQEREAKKRELIEKSEINSYLKDNPLDKRCFKSDIKRYSSIYVFSFGYAKLESSKYKKFINSLNSDNSYKVYFGEKKSLSKIVGLSERNPELKPEDLEYELRPGLHKIGRMLASYDDAAVLLTDKTKDEVLRKLKEYIEFDFVKTGQTPMEPLVYQEDQILHPVIHPRSNANNLCVKLKELGMPVELCGGFIKLNKDFKVCENGVRVTEDAAKILKLLKKKMFKYVLVPLCCWSASTEETEFFDLDLPRSR